MIRGLIHASNEILLTRTIARNRVMNWWAQAERKIMDIAKAGMVGETIPLGEVVKAAFELPRFAHRQRENPDD